MSRTASTMVELGFEAPAFELTDVVSGRSFSRDALFHNRVGLLVLFVCPHCPYVKHIEAELGRLAHDFRHQVGIVAIQSNAIELYPEDGPDGMRAQAQANGWTFPYLLDDTQEVARAFDAACTPDLYLFDRHKRLVYRGQLDASRPRRGDFGNDLPVTGEDLRQALAEILAGRHPSPEQRASIGCNIKWREA